MLATLVIGLREGLEAALIVGIIAAFLRRNGKSLTAMWIGVALAVALSIAVGVGLDLVEQALPQSSQEAMEAVIGTVAVVFVTGMIAWMNAHARDMKRQIEADAAEALGQTGTYALASMAFLAVLREGFETSVFLLATFSASQSAVLATAGAVIGLLAAVVIGWGIYIGGVRIHLGRFFRITGAFLILVAAGLLVTSLRSAHEAGWLNAGQQMTMDLAWLVAPGTVRSALITGVLGIPSDPRLIEAIGWLAYLIPVTLYLYWPRSHRPQPLTAARLQLGIAAVLAAVAIGLAVAYPTAQLSLPSEAPILAAGTSNRVGSVRLDGPASLMVSLQGSKDRVLSLPESGRQQEQHAGIAASAWTVTDSDAAANAPATLTLDQVVALAGGRIPVGLNPAQHPGPYNAVWSIHHSTSAWVADGLLLDAAGHDTDTVTLSGSGLQTPRTIAVKNADAAKTVNWQVDTAYRDQAAAALRTAASAHASASFWTIQLPVALAIAALIFAAFGARRLIRLRRTASFNIAAPASRANPTLKGKPHAAQ
jgi:high-affinity iron transporter